MGYTQTYNQSTGVLYPPTWVPDMLLKSRYEDRPASQHGLILSTKFIMPTNWSHSGGSSNHMLPGAFRRRDVRSPMWSIWGDGAGWGTETSTLPGYPSNLENTAVNKALLKLKNQKVDLAVAFGERKELEEMVYSFCNYSIKAIDLIRKVHPKGWARALKNPKGASKAMLAIKKARSERKALTRRNRQRVGYYGKEFLNDYLAFQYGMKPFMQDCYGAADALNHREVGGNSPYTVCVKASTRNSETKNWFKSSSVDPYWGVPVVDRINQTCFVRIDYYMDNPINANMSALGITNPAAFTYELTGFSFVLDWVFPLGDYLSAFDADFGYQFRAGSITKVNSVSGSGSTPIYTGTNPYWVYEDMGTGAFYCTKRSMIRTVLTSSPWPKVPSLKNPFSGVHVANAIALIASRFRL